jgi:hypothetical protein
LFTSALALSNVLAAEKETRFFEMRTYYAAPGKLDDLLARFREHTTALFEKHGMVNIGYWTPLTNSDNKLIYLLAYPGREARATAWKEFGADPAWQAVVKESERNGKLVTKVESVFLTATDFSPAVKPGQSGLQTNLTGSTVQFSVVATGAPPLSYQWQVNGTNLADKTRMPRVFELRTYRAAPGKLDALLARFRDHTTSLFARHGMTQFGYWTPTENQDGAGETLIYILAHRSPEACEASFKAFRADPDWVKAKADSEVDGPLTVTDGVKSVLMVPTDFSPAK